MTGLWHYSLKRNGYVMLWEVDIFPREGQPNREADRAAADLGVGEVERVELE